jgi:hypothetical protein
LCHHLGYPFPWPALLDKIGQRFRAAIDATLTAPYAAANQEQSGCRYEPAGVLRSVTLTRTGCRTTPTRDSPGRSA